MGFIEVEVLEPDFRFVFPEKSDGTRRAHLAGVGWEERLARAH